MTENQDVAVDVNSNYVKCQCGFEARADDSDVLATLLDDHRHYQEREGSHWYEYVFSFWGLAIAFVIAVAVVNILTKQSFFGK